VLTKRAGTRAATRPAMLGASCKRRNLPERAFAEPALHSRRNAIAHRCAERLWSPAPWRS
jgi:hypothetical protein